MGIDVGFMTLKNDISSMMSISATEDSWHSCLCPVCRGGSGNRKTAGFLFTQEACSMHCFRASCGASCVYEKGQPIPKKFKELMEAIGVKIPVDLKMVKSSIQLQIQKELEADLYTEHTYNAVTIPDYWRPIRTKDKDLIDFFEKRKVDPSPLYIINEGYRKGIGAYPMHFYNKLIGFQLVNPYDNGPRYQTYTEDNSSLLMINGGQIHQKPLVVEGAIDALSFPTAIGTLNHNITKEQAYILRGKDVHLMPDKKGGDRYLKAMKRYGWKMIIPPWKEVDDLNDCVVRYGMIATARMITQNIYTDLTKAEVAYKLWSNS